MSTSEGKQCQRGPQQSAGLLSSRAACAAVLLSLAGMHGAEAFAPGMPISRGPSSAAATVASGLAMRASRPGRMVGPSMIYTPPSKKTDPRTLEEIKEALDRAVRIPSPLSRESPKVAVPRSPCTSLYGNWRPTTGTENWKSASGRTTLKKPTKSAVAPAEVSPSPWKNNPLRRGATGWQRGLFASLPHSASIGPSAAAHCC